MNMLKETENHSCASQMIKSFLTHFSSVSVSKTREKYQKTALNQDILRIVFSFLNQSCLRYYVSLVCKEWAELARPLIIKSLCWEALIPDDPTERATQFQKAVTINELTWMRGYRARRSSDPYVRISIYQQSYDFDEEKTRWGDLVDVLQSVGTDSKDRWKPRIQKLEISAAFFVPVWPIPLALGASLTNLHIWGCFSQTVFPWRLFLKSCPKLLHLNLRSTALYGDPIQLEDPQNGIISNLDDPRSDNGFVMEVWSLQTCILQRFTLSKSSLNPFLSACPELRMLYLIDVIPFTRPPPQDPVAKPVHLFARELFEYIGHVCAELCPKIRSLCIPLPLNEYGSREMGGIWGPVSTISPNVQQQQQQPTIQLQSPHFANIDSWGFAVKNMHLRTFSFLQECQIQNRLTSLEIFGSTPRNISFNLADEFMPYGPEAAVGNLLHAFMCQAPNLLHVKAREVNVEIDFLHPTRPSTLYSGSYSLGTLSRTDGQKRPIWACRNLRTLHWKFDERQAGHRPGFDRMRLSRMLFGYISRVCPKLQDLSIQSDILELYAEGGLCLLSRLKCLERLELIISRSEQLLEIHDLDWIQRNYVYQHDDNNDNNGTTLTSGLYSTQTTTTSISDHTTKNNISQTEKHILAAIESDNQLKTRLQPRSQSQTQTHRYGRKLLRNEGHQTSSMIDGVDLQHLGEIGDITKYFEERRLQRNKCLWPNMEYFRTCFIFLSRENTSDRKWPQLMKILRPDIKFEYDLGNY